MNRTTDAPSRMETLPPTTQEQDRFIERLRLLIDKVGSANALAKSAGVSQSGFQRYLAGGQPTRKVLIALAQAAQVDLGWLMTGKGDPRQSDDPHFGLDGSIRSLTRLPLYKNEPERQEATLLAADPAAGTAPAEELPLKPDTVAGLGFCRFWLSKHGMDATSMAGLYMSGNSMEPTIASGDTILVNISQRDIVDGDIYALRSKNTVLIKRIQNELDGHLLLLSDNTIFKPVEVLRADIDIIGRVVWRGSLF